MRAIQTLMPNPRHTEVMRIFVNADPINAWEAVRHIDLSSVKWIRFLFSIRTFADRLGEHASDKLADYRLGIDQITSHETGFAILHEDEGKEIVVGAIGKFWHLRIPFLSIKPDQFTKFSEPGWGKVAWSFTVEPFIKGSTICLELRTTATDDVSWKNLNRYYHVIGFFSNLIRRSGLEKIKSDLQPMVLPDHARIRMPGDELMPATKYSDTDHINIEAPPSIVWRYLMQLGCDRAGWYSIDFLDNGGVSSIDHMVKGWMDRSVGDRIAATPAQDDFFEVYQVNTEKYFVLGGKKKISNGLFKMTWSFKLEPIGSDATRLIVRARMIMSQKIQEWILGNIVYPPIHGLMEMVQLKTIKYYAERDARMRTIQKPVASSPVAL